MTVHEWETGTDPSKMLVYLAKLAKVQWRRGRLFDVACCRRIWHLIGDERSRIAVSMTERSADEAPTSDSSGDAIASRAYAAYSNACEACSARGVPDDTQDGAASAAYAAYAAYTIPTVIPMPVPPPPGAGKKMTPSILKSKPRSAPRNAAACETSSAIPSAPSSPIPHGSHRPSSPSARPSTTIAPSTDCPSSPMHWKRPAARAPTCCSTAGNRAITCGDAGPSI